MKNQQNPEKKDSLSEFVENTKAGKYTDNVTPVQEAKYIRFMNGDQYHFNPSAEVVTSLTSIGSK